MNGTQVDGGIAWAGGPGRGSDEHAARLRLRPGGASAGTQTRTRPGGDSAGTRTWLRAARDGDGEALQQFMGGLSLRTRYFRFFAGVPRLSTAMLRRMTGTRLPDGDPVDALVVTEAGAIIGHGMATDTRDSAGMTVTEIGVVVADGRHGEGFGSALTSALATRAQARGATALMMEVLAENHEMLALIRNRFPAAHWWHAGPYVTVHIPLPLVQEEQPRESAVRAHGAHGAHGERQLAGCG